MSVRDQQVRAVFRAALERPAGERTSFVAELTGDDIELRHSVELLLSNHDATDLGARAATKGEALAELSAGTVVGAHYRIEGVIGRGGMGVVYRATDTKLHRPVAIKFLAAVGDADVRRRFKQEAEATSSLNHPHIVTVYDVEESGGQECIVSELVDGGTLEDWMRAGRTRTWRQSVDLLIGVGDALAAAHAAGVLHRDVKPGNILIGSNGYAKLADFGLAKLVDSPAREAKGLPQATRNTRAGVVVGTIAYMSPEQVAGQSLDARSDIFSFAIVLYELLAGRRPFEAANELEVLKQIAHAAPPPLPDSVPEPLRAIVDKALEKDPNDRYQTMRDLVVDLRRLTRRQAGSQVATSVATERKRARKLTFVAVGAVLALLAALIPATLYFMRAPASPMSRVRFQIEVAGYQPNGLAISPDGERVTYAAVSNGVRQVWIRPIGALDARPLPGTENGGGPFWSPDGRRLAFFTDGKLKSVDIVSGALNLIADASSVYLPGAWARDGTILFTVLDPEGSGLAIGRISAGGGTLTAVTTPDAAHGEAVNMLPRILDGDHFLFGGGTPGGGPFKIYSSSLARKDPVALTTATDDARVDSVPNIGYAAGHLLYLRERTLVAQSFDASARVLKGDPVPIAEDVAEFSVSDSTLVYREQPASQPDTGPSAPGHLVWVDRKGQHVGEIETPPVFRLPVLSPDGQRLALSVGLPMADVWTIDVERGTRTRLTFSDAIDDLAVWSPDGTQIVFNSGRDGVPAIPSSLYLRAANGTGSEQPLLKGGAGEILVPFDWSRDGRYLVFGRASGANWRNKFDLWVLEMTGERTARPLIDSPFRKETAKFSPDGRWIAYVTNEASGFQVFVQPFPDLGLGKWPVSPRGGQNPRWRADGRELYYLAPDGVLMAVDVQVDGDTFKPGLPRPLFKTGLTPLRPDEQPDYLYDVTPDGERFLLNPSHEQPAVAESADAPPTTLNVIVNWSVGLGQK